MAAIICRSINDCIASACNACGNIICFPCQACGMISRELSGNFCTYLIVTVALNAIPIVLGLQANWEHGGNGDGDNSCQGVLQWMIINAGLCLVNIAAALYIVYTIAGGRDSSQQHPFQRMDYNANSCARVRQVVCYDPIVAIYIIFLFGFFIFHVVGPSTLDCNDEEVMTKFYSALGMGWLYLFLGTIGFACGVCCIRR